MPPETVERIGQYKKRQDREMHLLGRLLLRQGLIQHGYSEDCLFKISNDRYRRPFIDDTIDFNISRSGCFVVCALTRHGKVGIDIEQIKPLDLDAYKKVFSASQWNHITSAKNPLKTFYRYWTIKESVLKADGRGFFADILNIQIKGKKAILEKDDWFFIKNNVNKDCYCHLATNLKYSTVVLKGYNFTKKVV